MWDPTICIQCNQCALVCPHAAIRAKVYDESDLAGAPATFKSTLFRGIEHKGKPFTIQVAPEDCTGCNLCVNVCPVEGCVTMREVDRGLPYVTWGQDPRNPQNLPQAAE